MKNKNKNTFARAKWGTIAACFALILFVSIPMVNRSSPIVDNNTPNVESSQTENSNNIEVLQNDKEELTDLQGEQEVGEELQLRIDKLAASDCLGWIVYGNRIYIQDTNIDTVNLENNVGSVELSECLGRACDFKGIYQTDDICDGDLYMIANNPDILVLKLDNGGTVWLRVEE